MHPILFEIGGFEVGTYALTAMIALAAGVFVFQRLGKLDGHSAWDHVEMGLWAFVIAILSSKIFGGIVEPDPEGFVATVKKMSRYAGHFYIGFLAGATFLVVAFRRRGIPLMEGLDELAPGLALAHAIGRLGCFAAGCCYGSSCDAPWAVIFTDPKSEAPLHASLHPTQLYEMGAELLIFGVLLLLHFKWRVFRGHTFLAYILSYGVVRFSVEFFRDDPRGEFLGTGLPTSQGLAILSVIGAAVVYALLWRRRGAAK